MAAALPEDKIIGERLRTARMASGLPVDALAKVLRIAKHQLFKYERGESRLPVAYAVRLANMMGVSPLNLMPGQDARLVRINNRVARLDAEARDVVLSGILELLEAVEARGT